MRCLVAPRREQLSQGVHLFDLKDRTAVPSLERVILGVKATGPMCFIVRWIVSSVSIKFLIHIAFLGIPRPL